MTSPDSLIDVLIPSGGTASGSVELPGSKSMAQRYLMAAALADTDSTIRGIPDSRDCTVLLDALAAMGVGWTHDVSEGVHRIHGSAGQLPGGDRVLDLGNNGTALRFCTALAALRSDTTHIIGAGHRPLGPLLRAIAKLGGRYDPAGASRPPVWVRGPLGGGAIELDGSVSSQFASALLIAAAAGRLAEDLVITLRNPVSLSYVELTRSTIEEFGGCVERVGDATYRVPAGSSLGGAQVTVEGDASAAAFYLAAAALTGGRVTVRGLDRDSRQGDARFTALLEEMGFDVSGAAGEITVAGGRGRGLDVSLRDTPDLVPPLVALAPFLTGPTTIREVGHLAHKESSRLQVLARGLATIGVDAELHDDGLTVYPGSPEDLGGAPLDPHGDHRMAMTFALWGLRVPGVCLRNSRCMEKSDPQFLARLFELVDREARP